MLLSGRKLGSLELLRGSVWPGPEQRCKNRAQELDSAKKWEIHPEDYPLERVVGVIFTLRGQLWL